MAGSESQHSIDSKGQSPAAQPPRKPLQVMHISRKDEQDRLHREAEEARAAADAAMARAVELEKAAQRAQNTTARPPMAPTTTAKPSVVEDDDARFGTDELSGMSMADLLGPSDSKGKSSRSSQSPAKTSSRSVDDFDFDEGAFLAALDANEPVGTTGEVVTGTVIGMESDGVYVDIGGKAPGFMPKNECGLGVITNLKERFPKGLEIEVLVTREQNADGMVTISCRALALRQSWTRSNNLKKKAEFLKSK